MNTDTVKRFVTAFAQVLARNWTLLPREVRDTVRTDTLLETPRAFIYSPDFWAGYWERVELVNGYRPVAGGRVLHSFMCASGYDNWESVLLLQLNDTREPDEEDVMKACAVHTKKEITAVGDAVFLGNDTFMVFVEVASYAVLDRCIEDAVSAFWAKVAEMHDRATSGDIDPFLSARFNDAAKLAVLDWRARNI